MVLNPPRERPRASGWVAGLVAVRVLTGLPGLVAGSGGVLVGADDGVVGAEGPLGVVGVGVQAQAFGDALPGSVQDPAAFALVDGLPVPESGWRVPPGDAGAGTEQDSGDDGAVVTPAATAEWGSAAAAAGAEPTRRR